MAGIIFGNSHANLSERPLLSEAFRLTSFNQPDRVKCSLEAINSTAGLNRT